MNKISYEVLGRYYGSDTMFTQEEFEILSDAEKFAENNLVEYMILVKMKIAEKRRENECLSDNHGKGS